VKLTDFFKQYTLTGDQQKMLAALQDFLEGDIPLFLMRGYAGTGKTFLLGGLADFLKENNRQLIMLAPTGRAAKILSQKTNYAASTIHRHLYSGETLKDTDTHNGKDYDTFKLFFNSSVNGSKNDSVYVIDESSMVSNVYAEDETLKFGSGYLLNDLMQFVFPDPADTRRKIIFTGDNAQLPPVDMNFSPALDARYLSDQFGLKSISTELSEVVRQKENSNILALATMLRKSIQENRYGTLDFTASGEISAVEQAKVTDEYINHAGPLYDKAVIIAYSNASVYGYNQAVRRKRFPGSELKPLAGDKVVVVNNNYLYEKPLLNGDFGTLLQVDEQGITHRVKVTLPMRDGKGIRTTEVPLHFRKARVQFSDNDGDNIIECYLLENLLFSGMRDLRYVEKVALLNLLKQKYGQEKGNGVNFRDMMKTDPFFNALRIKFGYALTCHKAQGGEWDHVYVNAVSPGGYNHEGYFRWLYTAITRARLSLSIINMPSMVVTTRLKEAGGNAAQVMAGNNETEAAKPAFAGKNFEVFTTQLIKQLSSIHNFETGEVKAIAYGKQFNIQNNAGSALIRVFHKTNGELSRIDVLNIKNIGPDELETLFKSLVPEAGMLTISGNSGPEAGPVYGNVNPGLDILQRLNEELQRLLAPAGILIQKKESFPYHEIYYFAKQLQYAVIKFHYNKKQQFTKFEIIENRSNGLQTEINPLLKQLKL
jgi:hypothetical protein